MKEQLLQIPSVNIITDVVEDNVLIKYNGAQRVVRLKGVYKNFLEQDRLNRSIVHGQAVLQKGDVNYALVGRGIQYDLQINPSNDFFTIQVYYPKEIKPGVINPERIANVRYILPGGIFAIEKHYDDNYVIVPVQFAAELLNYGSKRNSLEVQLKQGISTEKARKDIMAVLGDGFVVKTNEEIHADLYKILKIEKLFVFLILSAIIAIASINIYFVLAMMVIDKSKDISILSAQGASNALIRKIFLVEGIIVAFSGAFIGLVLGVSLSLLQERFGFISMGMETAIMEAYPVKVEAGDVVITCLCIVLITFVASILPSRLAVRKITLRSL